MRLFIAIPLPTDVKRTANEARELLEAYGASGRFVPKENYHVTLRFIGESDALSDAADALSNAAKDIRPFVLRAGGDGAFGGKDGHTGYLAMRCDGAELKNLYESLETALWERGFSCGRGKLTPHVTLGRNIVGDAGFVLPETRAAFTANSVVLYESASEKGRPVYRPLHRVALT